MKDVGERRRMMWLVAAAADVAPGGAGGDSAERRGRLDPWRSGVCSDLGSGARALAQLLPVLVLVLQ